MPPTIKELLDRSRKELLDLSTRNRLLSIPIKSKSARIIEIHDELSEQVFNTLITEKKTLSFLPGRPSNKGSKDSKDSDENLFDEAIGLPQPEDDEIDSATGLPKRHTDTRLQTKLTPEGLQRRLLDLYYDAQTMIEEQGVNVLYLAIGHLKWSEADHSDTPRYAPLILIPVELQRKSASERFHLRWREEDLQANLSLKAKLKADFGIELPEFSNEDELSPSKYFDEVRKVIDGAKGWEILPNEITLGFFSFAKFLMYRDLDPKNWPEESMLLKNPFITGLLIDGFPHSESLFGDNSNIDDFISVSKLDHIVDADSSQTIAIEAVRQGKSVVVQGPPGTGKSQSITNMIATAVLDGKRVLFIAEKLAALEVVKRRLTAEGLGSLCLELHSNKSNKKIVIDEIAKTWSLGKPTSKNLESVAAQLEQKRNLLNKHVKSLHEVYEPSGLTPFFIIGYLAALGDRGKDTTGILFSECEQWSVETRNEARNLINELAERIEQMGQPSQHPWKGVCRETILPMDFDPIANRIRSVVDNLNQLKELVKQVSEKLGLAIPITFHEVDQQRIIAQYVLSAPTLDKQAICNEIWNSGLNSLNELLQEGKKFTDAVKEVGSNIKENVWDKDYAEHRQYIAAHGKSLLRFLNSKYMKSIREVRKSLIVKFTAKLEEKLLLIDKVIVGQKALRFIRQNDSIGQSAFGSIWKNQNTNWNEAETILNWVSQQRNIGLDANFSKIFVKITAQNQISQLIPLLSNQLSSCRLEISELSKELNLDYVVAFAADSLDQVTLQIFGERCSAWLSKMEELPRWNNYFVRARKAKEIGLKDIVKKMETGEVKFKSALDVFDRVYFGQLLRALVKLKPELVQFDGVIHDAHISEFRKLDKDRLTLSKYRTLIKHHGLMPPAGAGIGPAGIVKSEMERKRGLRPVRKLLKDAGSIVQAIKPVFMMSPLSVAQFLEPGAVEFDLLVIDEASQVQPVDALGAIARCKQLVVVGDSKQLPPTKFFSRLTTDSADDEEDEIDIAEAKDVESILGLCCARGFPSNMLRWHYRSRHHSLIAVSNKEFYENELFIVPSPYSSSASLGLKFNHVPEGIFDSGNTGTNRVEAKAVCRAIIEHARKNPKLTLGVAAFSVKQRQAILDELELLRRECPDTEAFFSSHPAEPFFVKNLENVQGDERDVIFISVGYGKDVHGYMAMRFGPLSNEGGERRLNVLISRAKLRCEVFASITADDIDLQRASGRGVAAFKTFLTFAQTGRLSIARLSGDEEQSPFEEAVRAGIESLGYEVHPQVGIAGFFIDLAVLDKEGSGRYLLGVECDGASYHSSRSARDRDRLRQAVLEDHGWIIHRIWSIDWFQRPQEQLRKVAESIERAKIALAEIKNLERPSVSLTVEIDSEVVIKRESITDDVNLSVPYRQANFQVRRNVDPHEIPLKEMADIIFRIVEEEGPIHEDEIIERIKELWSLGRAGSRIQDAVASGIKSVLASKRCVREEGFLVTPNRKILIRNRENVSSSSLRKPDMLPPIEIRSAILTLINTYHGSTRTEIPTAIARLCGFKTTSSQFKELVEQQIQKLLQIEKIEEVDGMLKQKLV